jgi:polyphosphate kinase 2
MTPEEKQLLKQNAVFSEEELKRLKTRQDVMEHLLSKDITPDSFVNYWAYEEELKKLQIQLIKLQRWIEKEGKRVAILFEGRDAAGKGGAIRRFIQHLNSRAMRVVALTKPTEVEKGQWYFRRYVKELPNPGEIVFFDRSWYNRAVVEPVMGFCSDEEYERFMRQVPEFEHMLFEDNVIVIKFWFSISKEEQLRRFTRRRNNELKQWKLSPVDEKGQELWDIYTHYKEEMFSKTHTSFCPWIIVKTNDKKEARLESIRYVLSHFEYPGKENSDIVLYPDPNVIHRFHRSIYQID